MDEEKKINPSTGKPYQYFDLSTSGETLPGGMSDEWFWNAIAKYKGTAWYDTLASNPYLFENNTYVPSDWDNFMLDVFGSNEPWRKFYGGLYAQSRDWLSKKIDEIRQQGYDSAESQVAREKLAGLNPDINGGANITPGAAAENDQPIRENPYSGLYETTHNQILNVAKSGAELVLQVMSMAQGIQGISAGAGKLVAQDIANHGSAMDLLFDEVINTLPVSEFKDVDSIDSKVILSALDTIDKDSSFNSSTRKILRRYSKQIQSDSGTAKLQSMRQELANRYMRARKESAGLLGDPLYDEDFPAFVGKVGKFFNDYVFKAEKAQYDAAAAMGKFNSDYFHNRDGKQSADSANAADAAQKTINQFVEDTNKLWSDLSGFLKEDDSWYSKLALVFLPYLRALSFGELQLPIHFDNSTQQTFDNSVTNKYGPTVVNSK